MADGFENMVDAALAFFPKLAANNEKAWFEAHKDHYVAEIRKPSELLADLIAEDLSRTQGTTYSPKVFRIYRDVRFSKDKTPYKTHQHVLWSAEGALTPNWFFGMSPDYVLLGMGVMGLKGADMAAYRRLVDARGDDLKAAMADVEGLELSTWGSEPLKRVPKPYDADHPHEDLLRRKSFTVHAPIPSGWRDVGLVSALNTLIGKMLPIADVFSRKD